MVTDDDIELAQLMASIWENASTSQEFDEQANRLERLFREDARELSQNKIYAHLESTFQRILAAFDGDTERLARALLFRLAEEKWNTARTSPSRQPSPPNPPKPAGRPPSRWGKDGAGKLVIYFALENMYQHGFNGSTKDAIIAMMGITEAQSNRYPYRDQIRNYMSRYSEAKKILKSRR